MAEGLARDLFGESIRILSAGSSPSRVNPYAIRAMAEAEIELTGHASKSVTTIDAAGVDLVITLCAEEVCPVFLTGAEQLHWPLADPDRPNEDLSDDERLQHFCATRDEIASRLRLLASEFVDG